MKTGEQYGNYVVTRRQEISEIQSLIIELEHRPTGAQILQIANDDDENLFNLSFRTYPEKSNGVAHILEHTVLCGSKKFPVRDPFFSMNRRSLNTFMNALTGPDFTCYPASSQVPQDFYNLLEVYLDAVFHPILSQLSFLQEGHRLEFLKPNDPNSPLIFKGIVLNEMKGAMATPDARLAEELMHALFPQLTYGVNSGGDPKEILNLTYEELKEFHAQFYHPSRCLFYFYGNLPIERHLDFLQQHAFNGVDRLPPLPIIPKQPRFNQSVQVNASYPIFEQEDAVNRTLVGMTWLTCSILEQEDLLALTILDVVLSGTDAAPLKMALLKSNLCKQADSIIEGEMSEIPFMIICKGCLEGSADRLEQLVRETLEKIVDEGIPDHLIEAAIHQIEIARTEITGDSSPYGLSLFWRSALLKQHGGLPEDGLKIHTLFHQIEQNVKDRRYFPDLINKYFLTNPHFVRVTMIPDQALAAKEIAEEQEKLLIIMKSLNDQDIKKIFERTEELAAYQEQSGEHIELLPKVSLNDVNPIGKEFELARESHHNIELFTHSCFTNGLTYADLIFDLPFVAEPDLPWLRLFSLLLPQVGCGGRSYDQHLEYLLQHTGGIGVGLDLSLQAEDATLMRPSLTIRGKALNRNTFHLFSIFQEMVLSADFSDISRLKELLMQHFHSLENHIQQSPLRYAVHLAAKGFSIASKISSAWYGLDYYWWLKETMQSFEQNPKLVIENLQHMQRECLGLSGAHLVLGCEEAVLSQLRKESFYGITQIPTKNFTPWKASYSLSETSSQARIISSPVAFTAMLFPSVSYTHPHAAALSLAAEIMANKTLHTKIREQGGAYGSGAVNGALSGQFYLYSYSDPHLKNTLNAFHDAIHDLIDKQFDDQDVEEAKLGLFQDLDAPTSPGSRAMTAYSRWRGGRSLKIRQDFRKRLFDCHPNHIQQAAEEILLPGLKNHAIVSFAGKELLEKENPLLTTPLPIYPIFL